jgi:hypothetical protein
MLFIANPFWPKPSCFFVVRRWENHLCKILAKTVVAENLTQERSLVLAIRFRFRIMLLSISTGDAALITQFVFRFN